MSDYFKIYEDKDFRGKSYEVNFLNKRNGRLYSLKNTRVHDKMSSIEWRLSEGRKVIFYEDTSGKGRTYTIQGNGKDSNTHNNNFKDCASSWRYIDKNTIPSSFSKISTQGKVLKFERNRFSMPSGGHIQGIQQLDRNHMVISGSSSGSAFFFIIKWKGGIDSMSLGRVVNLTIVNEDFPNMKHNHVGGIQVVDDILVVGTEGGGDPIKSSVVFYDLSNVYSPRALQTRINRSWDSAGAVGMVKRSSDYLLLVGGRDSERIDFYKSNKRSIKSSSLTFSRFQTWHTNQKSTNGWIDKNWGNYQGLNLLRSSNGFLYLVGFNRNVGDGPGFLGLGQDWVDLFSIHLSAHQSRIIRKVDKKHVRCKEGASFRWGGGVYAPNPMGEIKVLAVERDFHTQTTINIF